MEAFIESFLTIFHFVIIPEKIDWQLTVWDRGCLKKRKAVTKIEKPAKRKSQAEKKQKKQQKPKELVHRSLFTSEESFNRGDSDYLVSKDEPVALQWKDSKVVMLLTNCMHLQKESSCKNDSTQFRNYPRRIVDKLISFSKTQNYCRRISAHCWITTTIKRPDHIVQFTEKRQRC